MWSAPGGRTKARSSCRNGASPWRAAGVRPRSCPIAGRVSRAWASAGPVGRLPMATGAGDPAGAPGPAAGLAAAHAVSARHRVTLVEAERRLGGHAWTWHVGSGPDEGLPLDLGFMVMNDRNYPTMHRLLDRLGGVAIAVTEMSFGFWDDDAAFGFVVNGPPNVGAPDPHFLRLLKDLLRFQRRSQQDLDQGTIGERSLDEYLIALAVPAALADDYLIPMGAAIWSTAPADLRRYPAPAFLAFFRPPGLLSLEPPPRWQ